ncbi:MAG: hypothetical protein Q4F83_05460 [Eubacteriales bacterium]|nr:hypothetical protein [Eubacteriales bacterium]
MKPCMMKDLMCIWKTPLNDKEYADMLQKKIKFSYAVLLFGALLLGMGISNECLTFLNTDSFMDGVYSGVGTGIIAATIRGILKNKKLLKDAKMLHEERIETYDERRIEISQKAVVMTYSIFCIILFAAMLVAGFFNRIIFWCCWMGIILFALVYLTVVRYYNKHM